MEEEKQLVKKIRQYITEVNNTISGHTLFLGNTFIAQIRRLATYFSYFYTKTHTLQPLYNTFCYNLVLDITQFKDGS